jgi:hypothetical protein
MVVFRLPALALAAALLLPANLWAAPPEVPMPRAYNTLTVTVDGSAQLVIAVAPQEAGGKIAFCGAVWTAGKAKEALSKRRVVLAETVLELRGKIVPVQLNQLPVYASEAEAKKATCAVSKKPWEGPYNLKDLNMRLRSNTYRG